MSGAITSTGLSGSSPGADNPPRASSVQHGQLDGLDGFGLGVTPHDVSETGMPGSVPQVPKPDGGTVTVTNAPTGIPNGTRVGSSSTSKSDLDDPFTGQHSTSFGGGHFDHASTGAGRGTPRAKRP
jgi:hypothetical protein